MNPFSLGNTEQFSLLAPAGLRRLYEGKGKKPVWLKTVNYSHQQEDFYMKYIAPDGNNCIAHQSDH